MAKSSADMLAIASLAWRICAGSTPILAAMLGSIFDAIFCISASCSGVMRAICSCAIRIISGLMFMASGRSQPWTLGA